MLNLRKDLYARLVISAQKSKDSDALFRVSNAEFQRSIKPKTQSKHHFEKDIYDDYTIEDDIRDIQDNNPTQYPIDYIPTSVIVQKKNTPKMDERISGIINNPYLSEIQMDLTIAEALLQKIKAMDADNPKIPILEKTVSKLKAALEQKRYV